MKPLSRLDISKLTAEKLNLNEAMVDEIARSFYSYLNKELSGLDNTAINVAGLGTFFIRKNKVNKAISKQKKVIDMLDHKTKLSLARFSTLQEAKYKLEKLEVVLEKLNQEQERKKEFKDESTNKSMEK